MNHTLLGKEVAEHLLLEIKDDRVKTLFGTKSFEGIGQIVDAVYKKVYTQASYNNLPDIKLNKHLTKEMRNGKL